MLRGRDGDGPVGWWRRVGAMGCRVGWLEAGAELGALLGEIPAASAGMTEKAARV